MGRSHLLVLCAANGCLQDILFAARVHPRKRVLEMTKWERRVLHSKVVGEPCTRCGTPIERMQYLSGASYFCSSCQT